MNKLQHDFSSQFGEGHREPLVELTWNDPLLYLFSPSTTKSLSPGYDAAQEKTELCGGGVLFVDSEVLLLFRPVKSILC